MNTRRGDGWQTKRRVHERLVVDELVLLGGLDLVVEEQSAAVADGVADLDLLEASPSLQEGRLDFQRDALALTLAEVTPDGHRRAADLTFLG